MENKIHLLDVSYVSTYIFIKIVAFIFQLEFD